MRRTLTAHVTGSCLLLVLVATACAQETITDPKQAGLDHRIQGEYLGPVKDEDGVQTWGAQVIALGDGKFRAVGFAGGLPGAGWNRGDETVSHEGQLDGQVVKIGGDGYELVIDGKQLAVHSDGVQIGTLRKVVRESPTLNKAAPDGAVVLFDGKTAEHFENGKIVMENLLSANCSSADKFGDHRLHLEFRTPFKPKARGQARGNSGVYVQSRYEIQVLDSFGLEGKNNECGGIYSIAEPKVNMCFPPLTWQTYDIDFTAARYDDTGKKIKNARVTVRHNGVAIHDDLELPHGTPGKLPEGPGPGAVYLQGHGNPVVYRNIWVEKK